MKTLPFLGFSNVDAVSCKFPNQDNSNWSHKQFSNCPHYSVLVAGCGGDAW